MNDLNLLAITWFAVLVSACLAKSTQLTPVLRLYQSLSHDFKPGFNVPIYCPFSFKINLFINKVEFIYSFSVIAI